MRTQRKAKKSDSTTSKLILEEIIGLTTKNANGLSANMSKGDVVYLAGCIVVVYNVDSETQSHLMVSSRTPKHLTCVAVLDQEGGIIAAGESGHQPAVLIWDYSSRAVLAELKAHRYGVSCIAFSPNGKHLISVGFPHDGYFCLWDWRNGRLVTQLKSSSSCSVISSVIFSSDAKYFVTAGKKHMKFWTVESSVRSLSNAGAVSPAMDGKSANLGFQKGSSFVSVASATLPTLVTGRERTVDSYPIYALTDTGVLCVLGAGRSMKKWVELKVERAFGLSVSNTLIACACNTGIVQLFTVDTLELSASLQYSELKDIHDSKDIVPDAIACQFASSEKLVVIYGNHNLYVWDVCDVAKVSKCSVLVSHSACIWDVKNLSCENMHDPNLACVARGCCGGVSFATCSTDGTIRLWDLALRFELEKKNDSLEVATGKFVNGSIDAEKVGAMHLVSAGTFERDIVESGVSTTQGFRSMAVSSDGKHLAAGDSQGNLHVYNLHTADYTCIQNAHEAEILSLTFSLPSRNNSCPGRYLLASGGRDRMVHLYDVERNFELIESLDDHSAAVTSVHLTCSGSKILSCSADRSLIFRDVEITDTECKTSRCHNQIASNGTVYDMALDPATDVAVTVGQDKKINTFSISNGKLIKTFKQDKDLGEPIKVSIDPSSSYLICSYSNKSICIYDFTNGEIVAQAVGHSEVITGIIFLPDCKHIISVGGDGCIFVWRLPLLLSSKISQTMIERAGLLPPSSMSEKEIISGSMYYKKSGHPMKFKFEEASDFRFSISRLPSWAQTQVATEEVIIPENSESTSPKLRDKSSSDANGSSSPTPCDVPSFAMDGRWHTIHTVYHDLLDSPQGSNIDDIRNATDSSLQEQQGHNGLLTATTCSDPSSPEKPYVDQSKEISEDEDLEKSSFDEDLFSKHFSNLSNAFKIDCRKARRSYSARFILRRDHITGCKKLFDASDHCGGGEITNDAIVPIVSNGDQARQVLKESQPPDSCKQNVEENEVDKRIAECKEALVKLDTAAKTTLQSFSEFKSIVSRESSSAESVTELYDWAGKLIPEITEKLQAVSDMVVQPRGSSGSNVRVEEDKRLEPLLQKFAESLSSQVLELVKKGL